ncbi:MAG: PHP domain-containing protein, partial [Actinomycetota bacterium]
DLHTHSNESDGTDTPLELLNKVAEAEIDRFALTDHDSIAGWQQIKDLVPKGIELVIGAEVSCQREDALSVHMLGFLFDPENKALIDSMNETRGNRITRMERIVGRLQEAGIDISVEDVYAEVSEGATIGRPHLADAMIRKGIVRERGEAFERFLHNRSKFYIPDASPTPEEAIRLIKEAGGVAVIAHPFASLRGRIISSEYLESLIDAGLDGIEIFHRDHSEGEREQLLALVRRYALLVTGGSDYHGKGKVNRLGENLTELSQWEKISERATGYTKGA